MKTRRIQDTVCFWQFPYPKHLMYDVFTYIFPLNYSHLLDPKTMKNEGFQPPIYGL